MGIKISNFAKKLLTKAMAVIMLMSIPIFFSSTTAFAAEIDKVEISADDIAAHREIVDMVSTAQEDGFEIVSEITTLEDDGIIATTKLYEKQENSPYSPEWTYNTYKAERVFTESVAKTEWVKITVWGTFRWDKKTAYVSNAGGTAEPARNPTSIRITENPVYTSYSDCGSNFLFGNKYAYVEKCATATNDSVTRNYELELVVNRKGKVHTNPSGATIT